MVEKDKNIEYFRIEIGGVTVLYAQWGEGEADWREVEQDIFQRYTQGRLEDNQEGNPIGWWRVVSEWEKIAEELHKQLCMADDYLTHNINRKTEYEYNAVTNVISSYEKMKDNEKFKFDRHE